MVFLKGKCSDFTHLSRVKRYICLKCLQHEQGDVQHICIRKKWPYWTSVPHPSSLLEAPGNITCHIQISKPDCQSLSCSVGNEHAMFWQELGEMRYLVPLHKFDLILLFHIVNLTKLLDYNAKSAKYSFKCRVEIFKTLILVIENAQKTPLALYLRVAL